MARNIHIESFLEMLVVERAASKHTIDAYRRDLQSAEEAIKAPSLAEATESDLAEWLSSPQMQSFAATTQARRLSAIRQFFSFLQQEGVRVDNPARTLAFPRLGKRLPKTLQESVVERLFRVLQDMTAKTGLSPSKAAETFRMQALLEVLYATGLRVTELVTLPLAAWQPPSDNMQSVLIVRGKGNKDRMVPLSRMAVLAIKQYLPHRAYFLGASPNPAMQRFLFPSRGEDGHITRQRFGQLLKELAMEAGLDPSSLSPHTIRHAFATHLLERGVDLRSIQKFLGHANISTTEIYTHLASSALMQALENGHPLASNWGKAGVDVTPPLHFYGKSDIA